MKPARGGAWAGWLAGRPAQRALTIACCAWIALILIPLVGFCFYTHPLYDDFSHTASATAAWARTGSLWGTLQAAWGKMVYLYENWQGTFAAMFFSVFTPMVFSDGLFFLSPLMTVASLALSAWYLVYGLARRLLRLPVSATLLMYAVFLTLWLGYLPGAREAIYWQSGVPYAVSAVMLALLGGLLVRLHIAGGVWRYALLALCATLLGGCPYPLALGGAVALALVTLWLWVGKSKARFGALVAFVFTLAALVVVVAAPGNAIRQTRVGEAMNPVRAVIQSVAECLQLTGGWFSPQLVAAALLLGAVLWQPLREANLRFTNPVWFTVLSFGTLAAAFVPGVFATGTQSSEVDRIQATLYLFFILVALANTLYWLGYAAQRSKAGGIALSRGLFALCAGLAVWGLFASAIMTTPVVAASASIVSGQAAQYSAEMTAREQTIAGAQTMQEAVDLAQDISVLPALARDDGMGYQKEALVVGMHRYYATQQLLQQYGAGKIPQAELDKLDAWK